MDGINDDMVNTIDVVIRDSDNQIDIENSAIETMKSPETITDQYAIAKLETDTDEIKQECQDAIDVDESKLKNIIILGTVAEENKEQVIEDNINEQISRHPKRGRNEVSLFTDHTDSAYDIYVDSSNRIYKNYRLRAVTKKPNYRDPTVNIQFKPEIKPVIINCPQCSIYFKRCSDFRVHFRNNHNMIFTCLLCSQTFDTNKELIKHKAIHDDEDRNYLCHECKQAFSNHCDYLMHELTHSKRNSVYTCPECSLKYYKKYSYEIHINTHFNKPLTCPICSKEFNGEFNLNSHIKKHSVSLKCIECGMVFNEKIRYDDHMAIHTGVKLYQCLYCGKAFRLAGQRTVHTRIHTQEKRFKCEQCDEKFRIYSDYQRHLSVKHETLKKLTCPICKKNFKLKMYLKSHMSVHSKEYKCPECNEDFPSICGLRAHVLYAHITQRREACLLCNLKFINKNSLSRHFRSKTHKNNVYKDMLTKKKVVKNF